MTAPQCASARAHPRKCKQESFATYNTTVHLSAPQMNPGKDVDAPALVAPTSFEANKEIYVSRDALAEAEKAPPARVISDAEFSERYAAAFGVARRLERGVGGNNDRLASTVNNLPEPKNGAQPLASEFVDEFANPYTRAVVQFDRAGGSA